VFSDNLFDDCDAGNRWLWRGPKRFYSGQWRSKDVGASIWIMEEDLKGTSWFL